MKRPFSTQEATRLIEAHNRQKEQLNQAEEILERSKREIEAAANLILTQKTIEILRDVPIESINRDKKGFRIKTLKSAHINTVADAVGLSALKISQIKGISLDMAFQIQNEVRQFVKEVGEGCRIQLNADQVDARTTRLISAIAKYNKCIPFIETCKRLQAKYGQQIDWEIERLMQGKGRLKWVFSSAQTKEKTIAAYQYLMKAIQGDYGETAREVVISINSLQYISPEEAWNSFKDAPILFTTTLENIIPNVLGNDDSIYGLPDDLAKEIEQECFFPDGLLCTLRRYQEWGVKYILHQEKVLLGDEMGLGKTIQAIAAMVSLKNTGATHFIVICPASVLTNWCREIKKHSRLTAIQAYGPGRDSAWQGWMHSGGVAVTTYETAKTLSLPDDFSFSFLIVDEAHYIKNPQAQRTQNVQKFADHAERILFMTGTALENNVDEMVFLIQMLKPDIADKIRNMSTLSAAPRFRQEIVPVYYRRKREDVLKELPELIESQEWCTLLPQEEEVYEKTVLSRAGYMAVRRVSWNVTDLSFSSKAKRMLEIIQEATEDGRKVLVFSFFLATLKKVKELLGERCLSEINGAVSVQRRQEIIDEFEKAEPGKVLTAQIQSGGTGLNIQSASVVIICEPQLKPSIETQAISRAYRMGQTRNVLVYRLLCENTIDERITELLTQKQQVFDAFADQSVAAQQSVELDQHSLNDLIQFEIDRINEKYKTKD